jgi:O-antigen ligase
VTLPRFNARLAAVCLATASAGLSIAIISLAKVLLLITALVVLLRNKQATLEENAPLKKMWTPRLVLLILFVFAASLLWTSAPMSQALGAMGKYGKFLVIPALLVLIRTLREATWALVAFLGTQAFRLFS